MKNAKNALLRGIALRDRVFGPRRAPYLISREKQGISPKFAGSDAVIKKAANLRFIHVGKCGGTSIIQAMQSHGICIEEDHLKVPSPRPGWVFIWVRNPKSRFVSAFNHSKAVLEFDIGNLKPEELSLENCPAPGRIRNRLKNRFTFDPTYDALINSFESANALAESLSSSNPRLQARAKDLFSYPKEHIAKGFGYYLSNGMWVKRNAKRVFFVGCLENMEDDLRRLTQSLNWNGVSELTLFHSRIASKQYSKELSGLANRNLSKEFCNSDYPALKALAEFRFISQDSLLEYLQ